MRFLKGVLGEGWALFWGKGGSAYTPTLLSTSDVSCNKKVLQFGMAVGATSLRTLLPSKLVSKFGRSSKVVWIAQLALPLPCEQWGVEPPTPPAHAFLHFAPQPSFTALVCGSAPR